MLVLKKKWKNATNFSYLGRFSSDSLHHCAKQMFVYGIQSMKSNLKKSV